MISSTKQVVPKFTQKSAQSIEEYSAAIHGLNLRGHQLSKGDFNGSSSIVTTNDCQIGLREAEAKHLQIGKVDRGGIAMVFPLKNLTYILNGKPLDDDSQIIRYGPDESKLICPEKHKHLSLLLDSQNLDQYLNEDEIGLFLNTCKLLHKNKVSASKKAQLTHHLYYLYETFQKLLKQPCNPLAYQDCCDTLFYAVNEYYQFHNEKKFTRVTNRERLLARSLDYIHHSNLQTLTVSSLVKAVHASSRSIQYCFSEVLGMTAKGYLVLIRLNAIRTELLQASPAEETITRIANKYGIINVGRFKKDYEHFFNESPRDALNKV